jgi:hypothetical protein
METDVSGHFYPSAEFIYAVRMSLLSPLRKCRLRLRPGLEAVGNRMYLACQETHPDFPVVQPMYISATVRVSISCQEDINLYIIMLFRTDVGVYNSSLTDENADCCPIALTTIALWVLPKFRGHLLAPSS